MSDRRPEQRPTEEEPAPARPDRPLGVTIMTVANILFVGTVPILYLVLTTRGGLFFLPLPTLLVDVGLPLTFILVAIGTWRGKDRYRLALLILLTVYLGLQLLPAVTRLLTAVGPEAQVGPVSQILRNVVWLGANYWYFLRPGTIRYYRRPSP